MANRIDCYDCGGDGKTWHDTTDARGLHDTKHEPCERCHGSGDEPCGFADCPRPAEVAVEGVRDLEDDLVNLAVCRECLRQLLKIQAGTHPAFEAVAS